MPDSSASYPGDLASPAEVLRLAAEYRRAAGVVAALGRKGDAVTRAPFRLVAIQAIELYLNALLLHGGLSPSQVRGFQHDLSARTDQPMVVALNLRRRTADHLKTLAASREYLVSRYSPDTAATLSQVNRLAATLDEVAEKVTKRLAA